MAEFKPGDIVQLKSGGPVMTVIQAENDTRGIATVWCVWFGEKNKQEKGAFPETAVQIFE